MQAAGWLGCELRDAPAASESTLELVHTPAHVSFIRDKCLSGGGRIDATPDPLVTSRVAAHVGHYWTL